MSRIPPRHELLLPPRRTGETLSGWLYRELRAAVLEGRLKPGALLPPTRALAAQYTVARGTVVAVFEQLIAEGYLEARVGSGTSVNRKLPDDFFGAPTKTRVVTAQSSVRGSLSQRGKRLAVSPFLATALSSSSRGGSRAFCANRPSVNHFPLELWGPARIAPPASCLTRDVLGGRRDGLSALARGHRRASRFHARGRVWCRLIWCRPGRGCAGRSGSPAGE